jgi:hypothetical protein
VSGAWGDQALGGKKSEKPSSLPSQREDRLPAGGKCSDVSISVPALGVSPMMCKRRRRARPVTDGWTDGPCSRCARERT